MADFEEWILPEFNEQTYFVCTVDGEKMAHFVPDGTIWAGEVWWWFWCRSIGKG